MRKLFLLLLAATCFAQSPIFSQNQAFKEAIHAKLNFIDYGLLFNNEPKIGQGFEFAYFRNIAPALNVGVPFKLGLTKLPNPVEGMDAINTVTAGADLQFRLENLKSESKLIPFAFAGAGYVFEKSNNHLQFPFGAGLHFRLSPFAFLKVQGEFRKALVDNRDNIQLGLGYVYLLHPSEKKPTPVAVNVTDADRDGTPDSLDVCPTLAGPPTALGCPDADNDGLGDKEDNCPDEPGSLETNGCPDYDNDGFADKMDDCPTEAGPWKGCPDADFDGVPDKMDKCPQEKGSEANFGCPDRQDTDDDGFTDDVDGCPEKAGPINGCPDTDNDGVADNADQCPDRAGTAANNGCPEIKDRDKDGVADEADRCPDMAGPESNKGCPEPKDSDGDGVSDEFDKCPNEAGVPKYKGCPEPKDSDGDGIVDSMDECPNQAGNAKNKGCPAPDTDGDGIPDELDKCPTQAGVARLKGCPEPKDSDADGIVDDMDECPLDAGPSANKGCPEVDTDGDGVPDNKDNCPQLAGVARLKGCPEPKDSDGDGILDEKDNCPNEAGPSRNKGCPEIKDRDRDGVADKDDPCPDKAGKLGGCPDSDGDEVADNLDKCPRIPGLVSNNGCPEEKKEVTEARVKLDNAARAVQFESGKAILKDQSYDILDEVVNLLRKNPTYSLSISGYTDDVGDDDENFKLSQERAKACYDYLLFRGIKAERLRYAGFGEARPIASNETAEGRELNRRVEFELVVE